MAFTAFKKSLRIFLVATCTLLAAFNASALSCASPIFAQAKAKERFGKADLVFVGTLQKIEDEKTNGWGDHNVLGTFSVQKTFKGNTSAIEKVRIDWPFPVGRGFVIYAKDKRTYELCSKGHFLIPEHFAFLNALPKEKIEDGAPEDATEHLDFLNALPKPGTGGEASFTLFAPRNIGEISLTLKGEERSFTAKVDQGKEAHIEHIPAGVYRISSLPPVGYRFQCNGMACEQLLVNDRGFDSFRINLLPQSTLKIKVQDTEGQPSDVRAQFAVYDAATRKLIDEYADDDPPYMEINYVHERPYAAAAMIAPGSYIIGLTIAHVEAEKDRRRLLEKSIIFDHGAKNLESARSFVVSDGDNEFTFTLPEELKPIRTQLVFPDATYPYTPKPQVFLLGAKTRVTDGIELINYNTHAEDHPDKNAFWSLPGQSWEVGEKNFSVEGSRYGSGRMLLKPEKNAEIQLKLKKQ